MRIIVDGYNFIGRQKGLRGDLEKKRRLLIDQLSAYRRTKNFPVTVVFDGGDLGEERAQIGGVEVIFSGKGTSADEVICRMAEELREGCTVASSDREVQRRVRSSGGIAIYSGEFEARLDAARHPTGGPPEKEAFDKHLQDETEELPRPSEKKGNPRKRSKAERQRQGRLKRL
jgi:predicted RNA-binding protein with PIN domain